MKGEQVANAYLTIELWSLDTTCFPHVQWDVAAQFFLTC
jgi:hypothetical protein